MRKLILLFVCAYAFFFLSQKGMLPSIGQIKGFLDYLDLPLKEQKNKEATPTQEEQPSINPGTEEASQPPSDANTDSSVPKGLNVNYPPTKIQTYQVAVENGNLVVTGKATPYGKFHQANGVILYIQEARADKKTTIKVPFTKGKIDYKYPLIFASGDVILNLDEYYTGKVDDPDKVLGYAQYHLTDGNPYLLPSFMVQSNDPSLLALAQSLTNGKQSDQAKSKAIFDWVTKNVAYNAPLVDAAEPPLYSALQTYQSRVVLCSGYADLSAALHRAAGIETKVVYGENHAWNEVKLNGVWQSEDPTYGSGYIDARTKKFVHHYQPAYFTKTDKHKEGEYPW